MKKLGFIILAVVLTLGLVGVGYAAWSQTLNIKGTATVANFEVDMANGTATKPADASLTTFSVVPNTADKASYNTSGNAGIIATIGNAVPGIYTIPGVIIHNGSSIPLTITVVAVAADGTNLDASSWVTVPALSPLVPGTYSLAAGASTTAATVTITIPDGATQGGTYGFVIGVTAAQQ